MKGRYKIYSESLRCELIFSYRNINGIMEIKCESTGLGNWKVGEIPKGAILIN